MNKVIMTAAVAAFALAATAEGVSSQVVGYQTNLKGKSAFTLSSGTFINTTGESITLKEIKVATDSGSGTFRRTNFFLQFFNSIGNPSLVSEDSVMETFSPSAFASFGTGELRFWTDKSHWYLDADTGKTIVMDDYPIAPGRGFNIYVGSLGSAGVNVTFSGSVDPEDTTIQPANSTFFLSGNATPSEIKLKDVILTRTGTLRRTNFFFQFFNSVGNPSLVSEDATMATFSPTAAAQWGDGELRFWTDGTHWYLDADSSKTIQMDEYPIASGRGFNIYVGSVTGGVKVTLPSPIQDAQ